MGKKVSIDSLADAVMEELTEYNKLAEETMKKAVTKAGKTVRKEIQAGAPVQTGRYAKSWRDKKTRESFTRLEVTVYSPSRYMLAHLLEHGHAKRNDAGPELSHILLLRKNLERSSWKQIS